MAGKLHTKLTALFVKMLAFSACAIVKLECTPSKFEVGSLRRKIVCGFPRVRLFMCKK